MKIQFTNKSLACLCIVMIITSNSYSQGKKIQVNSPLPTEYANKTEIIFLNKTVEYITSRKVIFSTGGTTLLLHAAVNNQIRKKQDQLAKEKIFEKDTVTLPQIVINSYTEYFGANNITFSTNLEEAKYVMNIKIYDHGFHWATSSAAGMFVRTKIELINTSGDIVWEQFYTVNKTEKKISHNRKAINMYMAIDKLVADYEKDPVLLETTYKQVIGFLPPKLLHKKNKL